MSKEIVNDNTELFRKIVRDFNNKYGYNFKLPSDTDYCSDYAHPIHKETYFELSGQISEGFDDIYGIQLTIGGADTYIRDIMYKDLIDALGSENFKWRISALKQLIELSKNLDNLINTTKLDLLSNTVSDLEKESIYDMSIEVAKTLYKNSQSL